MYIPSNEILNKYADLLVNYALGGGQGVKAGEVVWVRLPETAKPLYVPLRNTILKAEAHPIMSYGAQNIDDADFYDLANDEQLSFFADIYMKGLIDQIDHMLAIEAPVNKYELESVDSKKLMQYQQARQPFMQWRTEKELAGKFSWTIALFGTEALAADTDMNLEQYWEQIILACHLAEEDPKKVWKSIATDIDQIKQKLTDLPIKTLKITGKDIDLEISMGSKRQWLGGGGRNIPSYEIFTSPDWRGTNGRVAFNQPLFFNGNRIEGISLTFKDGKVIESSATKGEELLREMIATQDADKLGEFSLTDARHSRITKFMGTTLYDENMGGDQGNMHLALGMSYKDTYNGDSTQITKKGWEELGFNDSAVHQDIINTEQKEVIVTLEDGQEICIYKDGQFQV